MMLKRYFQGLIILPLCFYSITALSRNNYTKDQIDYLKCLVDYNESRSQYSELHDINKKFRFTLKFLEQEYGDQYADEFKVLRIDFINNVELIDSYYDHMLQRRTKSCVSNLSKKENSSKIPKKELEGDEEINNLRASINKSNYWTESSIIGYKKLFNNIIYTNMINDHRLSMVDKSYLKKTSIEESNCITGNLVKKYRNPSVLLDKILEQDKSIISNINDIKSICNRK